MKKGDRINLKDGRQVIITRIGIGDFIGDPSPIYWLDPRTTETGVIFSDQLAKSRGSYDEARSSRATCYTTDKL
jgi:hypothetical protein